MRKYFFLLLSFVSSVGDAIFLTGVPTYLFLQSQNLSASTYVPIVIAISIILFRRPILNISTSNPLLMSGVGELFMVVVELVILALLPFVSHGLLLSIATIPLAIAYNTYAAAKFYRVQEYFFDRDLIFWTTVQGSLNRIGFILGGGLSAWVLQAYGIAGLISVDLVSFLAFGTFMLAAYFYGIKAKSRAAKTQAETDGKQEGAVPPLADKPGKRLVLPGFLVAGAGLAVMSLVNLLLVWERSSLIPSASLSLGVGLEKIAELRTGILIATVLACSALIRFSTQALPALFSIGLALTSAGTVAALASPHSWSLVLVLVGIGMIMASQLPLQKEIYAQLQRSEDEKAKVIANHWIWSAGLVVLLFPISFLAQESVRSMGMSLLLIFGLGGLGAVAVAFLILEKRKQSFLFVTGSLAAMAVVFALQTGGSNQDRPFATALLGNLPQKLDPAELSEINYSTLFNQVCARLTAISSGLNIEGDLAQSWEVSGDRLQYKFNLHKQRFFFDGSPVTAKDVVFSLERVRTNRPSAQMAKAQFFVSGEAEVTVQLATPHQQFLYDLSDPKFCVLREAEPFLSVDGVPTPNSAGVYRVEQLGQGQIDLRLWKAPFGKEVKENWIRVNFLTQSEAVDAFERGELDDLSFYFLTSEEKERIERRSKKLPAQLFWSWAIFVNPKSPLFANVEQRRSLIASLDQNYEQFLATWQTSLTPGRSIIPFGLPGYSAVEPGPFGENTRFQGPCPREGIRVAAIDGLPDQIRLGQAIEEAIRQWAPECSNIRVEFQPMDTWFASWGAAKFDLYFSGLGPVSLDGLAFFRYFVQGETENPLNFNSRELNQGFRRLSAQAEVDRDPSEVNRLAQLVYAEGFGYIFGYPKFDFYYSKGVVSARMNPLGMHHNRWWETYREQ